MLMEKDYLPNNDSWLKKRSNNMILSDYQINTLQKSGIDYTKYKTVSQILFDINEILDEEDDEELEIVAKQIDEANYYNLKRN